MKTDFDTDARLQLMLNRLNRGDDTARDDLIEHACNRLRRLTSKLLGAYPSVSRWEQTDDVFQQTIVGLHRALEDVRPQNVRAFMGLAATHIRRKLVDLARRYGGPEGIGRNHATGQPSEERRSLWERTSGPVTLQMWSEFHEQVDKLPDKEREVFNLVYYQGMEQSAVAKLLEVSERTVKRRWRTAKLRLYDLLGHEFLE